ncbi:hypothetical protein [Klebsiella quasipneumoniae]|uniref:hypothetical protein n=1 Tax=Klebsiella quasipneumoniae TaxID=1463165 RepID=UPI00388FBB85
MQECLIQLQVTNCHWQYLYQMVDLRFLSIILIKSGALSHGIKDKQGKYILRGEQNAGNINLVRDNTIDYTLLVVNDYTGGNGDSDKSSPMLCALREGQILIIECKNNFIRKPLRLDELRFEYN